MIVCLLCVAFADKTLACSNYDDDASIAFNYNKIRADTSDTDVAKYEKLLTPQNGQLSSELIYKAACAYYYGGIVVSDSDKEKEYFRKAASLFDKFFKFFNEQKQHASPEQIYIAAKANLIAACKTSDPTEGTEYSQRSIKLYEQLDALLNSQEQQPPAKLKIFSACA